MRKTLTLVLYAIILIIITHWRIFLLESWPRTLYVSDTLGFLALIAKTLNINFLQLKEALYFVLDITSTFILIDAFKLINLNLSSRTATAIASLSIMYFVLYPYNKVSDAGFTPLYVLFSIGSAITIYLVLYMATTATKFTHDHLSKPLLYSLKNLGKPLSYIAILAILTITIGQWDPRILLYPFALLFLFTAITTITTFLNTIVRKRSKYLKFLTVRLLVLITPLIYLISIIATLGVIRIQHAETHHARVPFVENAFVGERDVIHLLTGTSWIFTKYPETVAMVLVVSLAILFFIFIYTLASMRLKHRNLALYGYMFLLLYSIVMLFEHNISVFFDDIVKCRLEMCLNLSALRVLESTLLMFRVPRFMHFTNKVLITVLILFLAKTLEGFNINVHKGSSKLLAKVVILLLLLTITTSYIVIDMPIITRGATLNPNLEALVLGSRVLKANFFIADWNKEKIALEAYLREGLVTNALVLYDEGVIVTNVKGFAKALTKLNMKLIVSHQDSYIIIRSLNNVIVGLPILIPQGLSTGSLVEKHGYIPIYLDQISLGDEINTLMRFNVPIVILKDRNFTIKMLALNMLLSDILKGQHSDSLILVPSRYCIDSNPNLNVWSPGFIGDPHHGIFYEPKGYEYDYTYRLDYGVAQCRHCNSPLKIPFVIKHADRYTLLLRLMSTRQGVLNLIIDGNQIKQLHINRTQIANTKIGFEWIEIPNIQLRQGSHRLEIYWKPEDKKAIIYVNLIVIVPENVLRRYMETAHEYIEKYGIKLNNTRSIQDLDIKLVYKREQSGKFIDQLLALFDMRSETLYFKMTFKHRYPFAIVIRDLWGDTITFIESDGVREIYIVPTDYTKTAFIIIPRNEKIELKALIFKGYTTLINTLYLLALISGIPLSLHTLNKVYRHHYVSKSKSKH